MITDAANFPAIAESATPVTPAAVRLDFSKHPCFNKASHHAHGRIHLPVAPRCNLQCNFCN
ncbi:MAG: nitrogen fixation protein NifB, partial [Opitutaceae bacterium]